jgi:hypothetical protein
MRIDNPNDHAAELRDLKRRIRQLETASPLSNASIGSGGISILTPGENPGGGGIERYKLGHGSGTKSGFLFKDGNDWKTLETYIDERIATSHEYPNNRIGDLEGRMGSVEGVASGAASAASGAQSTANSAKSRADDAYDLAATKASQSSVNTLSSQISSQKSSMDNMFDKIAAVYNNHVDTYHPGGQKISG